MDIHLPLGYLNGKQMGPTQLGFLHCTNCLLRKPFCGDQLQEETHAVTWTFTPECWLVVVPDTSQVPPEA